MTPQNKGTDLPRPDPSITQPASVSRAAVSYLDLPAARALSADSPHILGAVGFGMPRPDFLPPGCPFIAAPLSPAGGGAMVELWQSSTPCRSINFGSITGACSDHLAFGAITLAETRTIHLEVTAEAAYLAIFDFLDAAGFSAPIRFWNYLTEITQEEEGLERYHRFNIGRHRAFSARLREELPPAASGVGGTYGSSVIYFLAAHAPARPVENPRQVSAFAYPPLYGPRSPSFSRASVAHLGSDAMIFVSGTASIVGHESRHASDLQSQAAETIENLRAVIGATGITDFDHWAFKIYLRNPAHRGAVELALIRAFSPACQRLYLHGEICRRELLVEIEAFCTATPPMS